MKVYAINLERAAERRKHVVQHLERRKMDFELIKAVDGKQLSNEELERLCDLTQVRARPNKLTSGAIGAALSHLKAYEKLLEDKIDSALIIEDDAILPKDIKQILRQVEKNLGRGEVIMLYYNRVPGEFPILSNLNAVRLDNDYSLLYPVNFPMSAVGYVIEKEAARALSEIILPVRVEADDWEYFFKAGAVKSLRCVHPRSLEMTQAETQIQPCNYEGIGFRHRVWRTISDNKIPVLYPLACEYLRYKERKQPIELVNEPSPVAKQTTSVTYNAAFERQPH